MSLNDPFCFQNMMPLNAKLSGDLGMKAKPQCKGRPAAIGRVLQRLVRSRFTQRFSIRTATPMRTPKTPPHQLAVRHRYKAPTYPAYSKLSANSPTTWARRRLPESNQTWRPNWTTKLPALATTRNQKLPPNLMPRPIHPTTTKMTGAPATNACSMRAYGMEPKAQCSRRRRACTGYVLMPDGSYHFQRAIWVSNVDALVLRNLCMEEERNITS